MELLIYSILLILPFIIFRPKDVFQPEFMVNAYFVTFIGIGPIAMALAFQDKQTSGDFEYVTYLLIIGYFSINAGFALNRLSNPTLSDHQLINPTKYRLSFKFISYILLGISAIALAFYFIRAGQIPLFQADKEVSRVLAMSVPGNGYLLYLSTLSMMGILLLAAIAYQAHGNKKIHVRYILILTVIVGSCLLLTGSRRYLMWTFLYFIIARHYTYKPLSLKKSFFFGIVAFSMINIFEVFRNVGSDTATNPFVAALYRVVVYLNNLEATFQAFKNSSPMYGSTFYMDILTILPGKQVDYQSWIKDFTGIEFEGFGMPPTIVGDLFINFGLIGVVLGGAIFGYLVRLSYSSMKIRLSFTSLIIYVLILEIAIKTLTSGISAQSIGLVWSFFVILAILITNKIIILITNKKY